MNYLRIVDMTGCVSFLLLILISIIYFKKKSILLKKLHTPLTAVCTLMLLLHFIYSFLIGSIQDIGFVVVFASGVLAVAGFVASIFVIIQRKKRTNSGIKLHVVFSLITFVITLIHIALSEMLL